MHVSPAVFLSFAVFGDAVKCLPPATSRIDFLSLFSRISMFVCLESVCPVASSFSSSSSCTPRTSAYLSVRGQRKDSRMASAEDRFVLSSFLLYACHKTLGAMLQQQRTSEERRAHAHMYDTSQRD